MIKLTSEQLARLLKGPTKKTVKKRWKKCEFCKEDMEETVMTSMFLKGEYHPECLSKVKGKRDE